MSHSELRLRPLCLHDEGEYRALQAELHGEGHRLGLQVAAQPNWDAFFWTMADQRQGFQLAAGEVAESPMVAITGKTIVGAAWFRVEGGPRGHLDIAVRPRYRRHGHGSSSSPAHYPSWQLEAWTPSLSGVETADGTPTT